MSASLQFFKYLSEKDRTAAACVCKEWNDTSKHPSLWGVLDLQNCQQASRRLATLSAHYQGALKDVNLEFAVDVTDEDLQKLRGNKLENLNLNACQRVTDAGVKDLISGSPGLHKISLYWNVHITDAVLLKLSTSCPKLTHLNLSGCKRITDKGLMAVARKCPELVDVDLTRCMEVTEKGYVMLARCCCKIQVLRMYACAGVNDAVLKACGRFLQQLTVIDACGAHLLTDQGAQALAKCHRLETVNFTWCVQLTDEGICPMVAGCPQLKLLSLHGLRGISNRTIEALAKHCSSTLHTLDVHGCIAIAAGVEAMSAYLRCKLPNVTEFVVHT